MTIKRSLHLVFALLWAGGAQAQSERPSAARISLEKGWAIQSSAKVADKGAAISTAAYKPRDWYPSNMPATVLTALINNKLYPDPYFGMNLRSIPGTTYPIGANFANLPMPEGSPFAVSWWYRTEFRLPASVKGRTLWLNFASINYKADIWLNGQRIASASEALGMYRTFEFDVTATALPGALNTLAVEVFPPGPNDLGLTFVDWNPLPADKDMGLVRDVYLLTSGPAALRDVLVASKVDPSLDRARLTIEATVRNATDRAIDGAIKAATGAIAVSRKVTIPPHRSTRVEFTPAEFAQLEIRNPQLWWPYGLGPQNLQRLHVEFESGGRVSDSRDVSFGIREITSELDARKHLLYKINGKNILIRGGGWSPGHADAL
jgi:exo-1,4-beta-D-glucosaminidase